MDLEVENDDEHQHQRRRRLLLLKERLYESGFISYGPFPPKLYNERLSKDGLLGDGSPSSSTTAVGVGRGVGLCKLPEETTATRGEDADRGEGSSVSVTRTMIKTEAYLIGNTKHLWPIFLRWLKDNNNNNNKRVQKITDSNDCDTDENNKKKSSGSHSKDHLLYSDPLDTYVKLEIERIVKAVLEHNNNRNNDTSTPVENNVSSKSSSSSLSHYYDLYWSSDWDPARLISMGRVASCTGFSYLDDGTHLNIHPIYGTWHSFRAVLLLHHEEEEKKAKMPSAASTTCMTTARNLDDTHSIAPSPCGTRERSDHPPSSDNCYYDDGPFSEAKNPLHDDDDEAHLSKVAFNEAIRISSMNTGSSNNCTCSKEEDDVDNDNGDEEESNRNKEKGNSKITGDEMHDDDEHRIDEHVVNRLCLELGQGQYNDDNVVNDGENISRNTDDGDYDVDTTTTTTTTSDDKQSRRKEEVPLAWIRLRDSISIGRQEYKFDHNQLFYHYTKDVQYLKDGIESLSFTAAP